MKTLKKSNQTNIDETLKKLERIALWFETESEPNLEEGLKRIEEAAQLLEASRNRLGEIENRFVEVKKILDREKV
jgi:exonuclease VII small subunit